MGNGMRKETEKNDTHWLSIYNKAGACNGRKKKPSQDKLQRCFAVNKICLSSLCILYKTYLNNYALHL